jgi:hypothetical protein
MTTKKTTPNGTFALALKHAEKELKLKTKELAIAQAAVSRLNAEIPGLHQMIRAMKNQLGIKQAPEIARAPIIFNGTPLPEVDPDTMGSIPANSGLPVEQQTPDLDALPGMDGEWT